MIDIEKIIANSIEKQKEDFGFSPFDKDELREKLKICLNPDSTTENLNDFFNALLGDKIQVDTKKDL